MSSLLFDAEFPRKIIASIIVEGSLPEHATRLIDSTAKPYAASFRAQVLSQIIHGKGGGRRFALVI